MRAALYVRVSTDRQQQAQTIEQQVAQLQSYVAAHDGGPSPPSTSSATTAAAAPSWTVPVWTRCATTRHGQRLISW